MKITVRYFASIREVLGEGETVELAAPMALGAVRDLMIGRSAEHARALARGKAIRVALDRALCDETAEVRDRAEVAFFPPVTGG